MADRGFSGYRYLSIHYTPIPSGFEPFFWTVSLYTAMIRNTATANANRVEVRTDITKRILRVERAPDRSQKACMGPISDKVDIYL